MGSKEQQQLINDAAAQFPATFRLRAYPDFAFRVALHDSYVNDAGEVKGESTRDLPLEGGAGGEMKQTVTRIQLIWDRDHGAENEGWYCRLWLSDGQRRDQSIDGTKRSGFRRLLPQARAEAQAWGLLLPRGVPVEIIR